MRVEETHWAKLRQFLAGWIAEAQVPCLGPTSR